MAHTNSFVSKAARAALLSGAAFIVGAAPALAQTATTPPAAEPQAAPADDGQALGDIVVTARRVNESVRRVPVTITAVTPEAISRNNITNVTDLQRIVPSYQGGAKFVNNALAAGAIRIRGVPGVANYFADVPFPVSGRAVYFDVQNIQVLQGPQGTLFGEASNAGAIVITPRKPGTEFGGFAEIEVGNEARKVFSGALDIPIVKDKILLRVAGKTGYVRGYIQDIFTGHRVGRDDYDIFRATLTLRPTDNLEIETLYSYEKMRGDGVSPAVLADFNFDPSFLASAAFRNQANINGMTVPQFIAARDYLLSVQNQIGPYKYQGWSTGCFASDGSPATQSKIPGPNIAAVVPNPCPVSEGTQNPQLLVNSVKWDFADGYTLKHVFGTSSNTVVAGLFDTDLTRLIIRDTNTNPLGPRVNQQKLLDFANWSSELQLVGKAFDDRLTFVSGWFNRKVANNPIPVFAQFSTSTTLLAPGSPLPQAVTRATTSTRTKAVYAQGDFKITDALIATLGARQTWDHILSKNEVLNTTTLAVTSTTGGPGTASGEGRWKSFSYTTGLRYQIDPDNMVYFSHAKGYSTGGLQNVAGREKFNPDNLFNFELGAKLTFHPADGVIIRTNLAGYYGLFNNVKVASTEQVPIPNSSPPTNQFLTITTNAGKARVTGVAADFAVQFSRFQFSVQGAYMHNYYTQFNSLNSRTGAAVDLSDTPFVNTPDWKFSASATYDLPVEDLGIGRVSLGADFSATPISWANIGKPIVQEVPGDPNTGAVCRARRTAANGYGPLSADGNWAYKDCAPPTHNLNMRIDWREPMGQEGLKVSLVAQNVTNFKGYSGTGFSYDSIGYTNIYPVTPRYIYLNIRQDF